MKSSFAFLLLLITFTTKGYPRDEQCQNRILSNATVPTGLKHNITLIAENIAKDIVTRNLSNISRKVFENTEILGLVVDTKSNQGLALSVANRLKIFKNVTKETLLFWNILNETKNSWGRAFQECEFLRTWVYAYLFGNKDVSVGLFVELKLDRCNRRQDEIFNGSHRCDEETMHCISQGTSVEKIGKYRCVCRKGFHYPSGNFSWNGFTGEDIETGRIDQVRCIPCPKDCPLCEPSGICTIRQDVYIKTAVLCIQLTCMAITVVLALMVFKQRKTKAIATGMWTILETILLGVFILYGTVVVKFFEPSVVQCLLEPWFREVGFIICYGAIILKLYRHLIEFRTRKAHRWVVKDTDLLKYLLIMIMSVLAYMAAYTSITLNFIKENYSLLYHGETTGGEKFRACKSLWWDYVTEIGELFILIFGIHLSYASRNARTQFHERTFLCAAISLELAVSTIFYVGRILVLPGLHPDLVLIVYCIRTQLSQTLALVLIFVPKFWYQQKQVRNLAQEYSCRLPVDAFKDVNAHGPLTSNNSDVDVGEITIADMSPDDIRAELKRLYLQVELFKSRTIIKDNPHISKRRGGRKAQHRRFSLQNLHGKHREKERQKPQEEVTECEPSRTPEDSVCSNEGPSAIYADLPSASTSEQHK